MRGVAKLFLFFLLLLPSGSIAVAGNETLIKGWIKQEAKTIDGKIYNFILSDEPKYVVMEFDGTLLKVSATFCDVENYVQLCVDDVQHNRTDPETKVRYYKAYVTVTRQASDVTALQVIDKKEGTVEDTYEIISTIENTGAREATDVLFIQRFPESFSIKTKRSDCILDSFANKVFWNGTLAIGQKLDCIYSISPKEAGKFSITGNISYNTGIADKSSLLGQIDLDIKNGSFEIQRSLSRESVEVGDRLELNASVKNVFAQDNQSISFTIGIPKEFKIINKTFELERDGNKIYWDGQLSKGGTKAAWVDMVALSSGNFSIPLRVSYLVSGGREKEYLSLVNITVSAKPIEILYKAPEHVLKGQSFNLSVEANSNTGAYYYDNIDVTVNSDMPEFRAVRKTLDTKLQNYSSIVIFNDTIAAPSVTENTTFNVTVALKYDTEFDQSFSISKRYEIFVEFPYVPPEEKYFNIPLENLKDNGNSTLSEVASRVEDTLAVKAIAIVAKEVFSNPVNIILILSTLVAVSVAVFMYLRMKRENRDNG